MRLTRDILMIAEEAINKRQIYLETFRHKYHQLMELWKDRTAAPKKKRYYCIKAFR
jgi:hypothetical protein